MAGELGRMLLGGAVVTGLVLAVRRIAGASGFRIGARVIWITTTGNFPGVITGGPFPSGTFPGENRWTVLLDTGTSQELEERDLVLEGGPPVLEAITVFPNPFSLNGGATLQFAATAVFTDGDPVDVTPEAVWQGAAPLINNGNGVFGAQTINNTTAALVTAAFGGLVGESSGVVQGTTGL